MGLLFGEVVGMLQIVRLEGILDETRRKLERFQPYSTKASATKSKAQREKERGRGEEDRASFLRGWFEWEAGECEVGW